MRKNRGNNDYLRSFLFIILIATFYIWKWSDNSSHVFIFLIFVSMLIASILIIRIRIRKKRLLNSGIDIIDVMSGFDFEKLVMVHFEKLGYKGCVTSTTNDYGADLVLHKDGHKIVVQAKRWKEKVGIKAIQEVVGSINYYNADKGMVITNSYFTPNAKNLAQANNIELWDRNTLIKIMAKNQGKEISENILHEDNTDNCPLCNGELILRHGRNGKFLGCSNFPKCRFTQNI